MNDVPGIADPNTDRVGSINFSAGVRVDFGPHSVTSKESGRIDIHALFFLSEEFGKMYPPEAPQLYALHVDGKHVLTTDFFHAWFNKETKVLERIEVPGKFVVIH